MMGGARSIDITDGLFDKEDPLLKEKILDLKRQGKNYYRIRSINWFPEEMPSEEERERGIKCLQKNGMETDYIITHAAPTMVSNYFSAWRFKADELTDYFEKIRKKAQFKR
ncbi:MAG: metallophosphatase, partial [Clostridium sp.]